MLQELTRGILSKYDIRLSKREGQSQVIDERILKRMVEPAELSQDDVVLEIGPGIGNLTELLIQKAGKVIAIEKDDRLVRVLNDRFSDKRNLEIIHSDVLEVSLPEFDKVVSNLPYSISSEATFKILQHDFELGILMYQKEFAQRMIASPRSSDYSRLSINVFYHAKVELLEEVPSSAFIPQPEVKSIIVRLEPREPPFEVKDEETFSRILRAAFQHRRKKLRNALYHSFRTIFPKSELSEIERREFIDETLPIKFADSRPDHLTPEDFGVLANILSKTGKEVFASE